MRIFLYRLIILVVIVACETDDPLDLSANTPTITSFTTHASRGGKVIIWGTNLSDATTVTFGGVQAASFTVWSPSSISAVVAGGRTGLVRVVTPHGVAETAGFIYSPEARSCRLPELSEGVVGLGFPRSPLRVPSTGVVRVSVLFGDFSDSPATQSPFQFFEEQVSPSAQYLNAMSYGKMTVELLPTLQWLRMSKPSTENRVPDNIIEAASLAGSGVDFSNSHAVFLVSPANVYGNTHGSAFVGTTSGDGFVIDNQRFHNGASFGIGADNVGDMVFAHEFGHLLGLPDLYKVGSTGWQFAFAGIFSVMGMTNGWGVEMFGYERWLLDWITDDQVVCQLAVGDGNVKLTPVEQSGGIKLLVIPLNNSRAVVVECRRALGYDHQLTKEGPLVYLVDTRALSGDGVVRVLPYTSNDLSKATNIMNLNQTLSFENVSVTYVATDEEGDEIKFKKN
jgi:M6 family metalloprotease-like protein